MSLTKIDLDSIFAMINILQKTRLKIIILVHAADTGASTDVMASSRKRVSLCNSREALSHGQNRAGLVF